MRTQYRFIVVPLTLLALGAGVPPSARAQSLPPNPVCVVLTQEIIGRMGQTVNVRACAADPLPGPWTTAIPDATARVGQSSWFTLTGPGRTARVEAVVHVEADHARAVRALTRGRVVTTDDIRPERGAVDGARFQKVPAMSDVTGARVMRLVEADAVVQVPDVVLAPVIKAGDPVLAIVRIGAVEVTASMTAVDAGSVGDQVRVAHKDRKRVVQARVLGPGRVAVLMGGDRQ